MGKYQVISVWDRETGKPTYIIQRPSGTIYVRSYRTRTAALAKLAELRKAEVKS